jgi:glycerophosphoryl diester phosphodiesterase
MLIRNQKLPPAPPVLVDAEIKVAYSNPVSVSQRSGELASINQLIQFLVPFAQIDPSIMQSFQPNRVAELAAEILKVSPTVFKTNEERQAEVAEQQQQQQMMQEMQQAQAVAQQQNLISESRKNEAQALLNESKAQMPS